MLFMAQKQYPFLASKYGNFCQVTLKTQKFLTSSNQILNLGSLKTSMLFVQFMYGRYKIY